MSLTFTTPNRPLTWLITGCSSGLGLSLTRLIQKHGHIVIATSRNPSRTPSLLSEIESKGGKWLALDVDDLDCGDIIEKLEQSGQHIDVLVNNAGYSIHACVEQFTEEEVRRQMETMYLGPCRLVRAVIPWMRKRRFGVIVNVSSGAALEGRESMGGYAPAKAALDGAYPLDLLFFDTMRNRVVLRAVTRHVQGAGERGSRVQYSRPDCILGEF